MIRASTLECSNAWGDVIDLAALHVYRSAFWVAARPNGRPWPPQLDFHIMPRLPRRTLTTLTVVSLHNNYSTLLCKGAGELLAFSGSAQQPKCRLDMTPVPA